MQRPSLVSRVAAMSVLCLGTGLWACGSDTGPRAIGGTSTGVTLSGQVAWLPLPSNESATDFAPFAARFVGREPLVSANANDVTYLSDPLSIPSTGPGCAAGGCSFQLRPVSIVNTTDAVFAVVAPAGAATEAVYVPTASMVLNNNQLLVAHRSRAAAETQGQALVVSKAGLTQLGKLTGLSAEVLLQRGVCLGFVASTRTYPSGPIPAESSALVTLTDAPAGAFIVYASNDFQTSSRSGTNASGAFIAVGPSAPASDGAGRSMPVSVAPRTASGTVWPHQSVIVRPGMVVAMPILPTP